ncbi:hypothetical protein MPTK1_8g12600 [Marchantia polymorpha subsp. ruderalis]|uniref:Uncharacterized protein n=1 Tax=Marchantia polymorpha TaxID=3197 RepID=A0A2R6WJR3_MARPO|nr:hypothetical protein MARPO_0083s0060 [Marchantia polymorpha]BBN19667.1 hypothetical protein Mp_8g12600 [Marchantia polymorpha subsp. ruderalis]|eukprot:PTQ34100.1 hypothetical protein MARPO_0083s0060 [Marchantia polymorpha]
MWNCLPLKSAATEEMDVKMKKAVEMSQDAQLERKRSSCSYPVDHNVLVAEGDDRTTVLVKMVRWQYTGVTLWFGYMLEYMGQAIVGYLSGVAEKLEKRELH